MSIISPKSWSVVKADKIGENGREFPTLVLCTLHKWHTTPGLLPRGFNNFLVFSVILLEHVYMRPEVNSNRLEISNRFEKSLRLHGDFTVAMCK